MTTQFRIEDATCGHCKATIESTVGELPGVNRAEMDLDSHTLTVEHDGSVNDDRLASAISGAGYTPESVG